MTAKLVERAGGFSFAFSSGFSIAAAKLGAPDTGLLSYEEVASSLRNAVEATRALPIIADGDTGYGNAVAVKRTVRGFSAAGAAGILIEDQVAASKACGHVGSRRGGKRVVGRKEALARVRAAVDARDELASSRSRSPSSSSPSSSLSDAGDDSRLVVVARSDARQAESLEEALWRAAAFADLGADVVFVDALASVDEMRRLVAAVPGERAHKMANNLEGGGRSPVLLPAELEEMGFKLVAYPLSLIGAAARAQQAALAEILEGRVPGAELLPSFDELKGLVGFPEYFEEAERYAVDDDDDDGGDDWGGGAATAAAAAAAAIPPPPRPPAEPAVVFAREREEGEAPPRPPSSEGPSAASASASSPSSPSSHASSSIAVVEPDSILVDGRIASNSSSSSSSSSSPAGSSGSMERVDFLRIKIFNEGTGVVKLETRIPAGFVRGLSAIVPQVAGMLDIEALARVVSGDAEWTRSKPVFEADAGAGDRVQVFVD